MSDLPSSNPLPTPALLTRDVRKSYRLGRREVEVLGGVSLSVDRGEFVALRGASGAGKSTLLHLLGGLDVPSSGSIELAGQPLAQLTPGQLAQFRNRRVGFVFQAYHLLPELDAVENTALPARIARVPPADARQRATHLLQRVGLGHRLDHRPSELSGGEQQRVAIARALVNQPELLLADEPTGNLDSHTGEAIVDLLCSLHSESATTLIIATHDHRVAARAPRILDLVDGQVALPQG